MNKKSILIGLLLITSMPCLSGCAVYMAANQPMKKDLNLLKSGVPRDAVLSELGAPISTEEVAGRKVDIFKFTDGYSQGNKTVRAVGHGAMDVLTLGLWEVVGTPTEAIANGREVAVKVTYDEKLKVDQVVYLKKN